MSNFLVSHNEAEKRSMPTSQKAGYADHKGGANAIDDAE